jgi:predicted dehydrogenase
MKRVCIIYHTGGARLGGHLTHLAFWGLPGVEVAGLCDDNDAGIEERLRLTGARRRYRDYREMIEVEKPDIVVDCSRLPEEHAVQIRFALEHGCHVLCEKPFAAELTVADDLIALATKQNLRIVVAHLGRYALVFQTMKQLLAAGEIGRVLNFYGRGKEDPRGGGEDMMVLGSHILDLGAYLLGAPKRVWADIRQRDGRPSSVQDRCTTEEPVGPCVGEEVMAFYRFPGGVNGIFESRSGLVERGPCQRMGLVLVGTKGSLAVRYEGTRSLRINRCARLPFEDQAVFEEVPLTEKRCIPGAQPLDYAAMGLAQDNYSLRYFADNNRFAAWDLLQAIAEKREPLASAAAVLPSLEMIVGAYAAHLGGRPMALPLQDRQHPLLRA